MAHPTQRSHKPRGRTSPRIVPPPDPEVTLDDAIDALAGLVGLIMRIHVTAILSAASSDLLLPAAVARADALIKTVMDTPMGSPEEAPDGTAHP